MPTSSLHARLADALREHEKLISWCKQNDWEWEHGGPSYCDHLVDVLLSLPSIAIVDVDRHRRQLFDLLKDIIDGEWGPYEDDHYWLMVDEFLAAAHAAEQSS